MSNRSIVEKKICSNDFQYLHPYFYNNPYALRCELGMGDTSEEYTENAKIRALEIYNILFPDGADAIIFNHWIYDYCDNDDAECQNYSTDEAFDEIIEGRMENAAKNLRFLLEYQFKYKHITVRNLQTYDDPDDDDHGRQRRNRVVCFSDGIGFDFQHLIEQEIEAVNGHEVGFVSFKNECIFSIYDDRGCDIVFMTREKLRTFYPQIKPYFLEYDAEEMERRYKE